MKRRRLLQIAAAAGLVSATPARAFRLDPVEWRGSAMGAAASLTIHHEDRDAAMRLLSHCLSEIERLERIFSLYRPESALMRLNRDGILDAPPLDLVTLLGQAGHHWHLTGGAFDPTVQPLWDIHARHFSRPGADPAGPPQPEIERALSVVGWPRVRVSSERISLEAGMALTLNGIAQGYITDRIAHLLRREGMRHVLVNLGEIKALGPRGDGGSWRVAVPGGTVRELKEGALAVSDADGTRFSPICHHIFDPATGRSAATDGTAAIIVHESATSADALSTAEVARPRA